jgi:M penetrans paralogue family 26
MENTITPEVQPINPNTQQQLPNATAVLVLGILSIVMCFCYGLFGVALGIIALILSGKAKALYIANPDTYTVSSYKNMNAGRVCGLIGTILSSIVLAFWVIYFIVIGAALGTLFTQLPWDSF